MPGLELASEVASTGLVTLPMSQFMAGVEPLTLDQRQLIVDQALLLMDEVYVHLPLKRAMHAVDPVQRLRLLRHRIKLVSEQAFHEEMISTFMGVRDLHTNYILPAPYSRATALLPFDIRELFHKDVAIYIVGGVVPGLEHPTFKPGVRVTHFSGVPIERAIALNARRHAGSNDAANHARGLERLTLRPLMMSMPPDELWVDVRYIAADGTAGEIRFNWLVVTEPTPGTTARASTLDSTQKWRLAQGVDIQTQAANLVKKHLFAKDRVEIEQSVLAYLKRGGLESLGAPAPDFNTISTMPDVFAFEVKNTRFGERGYVRIHTFAVEDPQAFVQEFVRILKLLPQDGLILDVRGNGGGNIVAGELLLQTLSPVPIEPERLHFITTPRMIELVNGVPQWFGKWAPSMNQALLTGATYSQGFPIEDPAEYNQIGRQYAGKVVLVTDALCYSTTDIVSAGFQDHGIGPILGTHACTGAGGANVFDWGLLTELFQSFSSAHPFRPLPRGADLRVAIRRTTRVRDNAGEPLEDLGVRTQHLHRVTLNDLLELDRDLVDHAAELTRA